MELETNSEKSFHFDGVVLTMPLGWLKQNQQTAFTPSLPDTLSAAIDAIGYGCLEKVYKFTVLSTHAKLTWLGVH